VTKLLSKKDPVYNNYYEAEMDEIISVGNPSCSICDAPFNLEEEGGIEGFLGIIPVQFCPTCYAGIMDMAEQLSEPWDSEPYVVVLEEIVEAANKLLRG
jgi:hypothetical protein